MNRIPILLLALLTPAIAAATAPAGSPHGELSVACSACHVEAADDDRAATPAFDHDATGFPLVGGHRGAACTACHASLEFGHVGSLCADCHSDAHAGQLGLDCEECHTERAWEDRARMRERHDRSAFPLRGAHAQTDCNACHRGEPVAVYADTPVDCYGCHAADYHATTEPAHGPAGFGHDCSECHDLTAASWGGDRFLHPATFPLTGAHARTACASCHTNGFGGLDTSCYSCHQTDYEGAENPDHVAADFPADCTGCHTTTAWQPATFDHDLTRFSLTGAHRTVDCASCHAAGYVGTPSDCYACHQTDFEGADDPDHVASDFPVDCTVCHTTNAWEPADFDHAATQFPLTGAHVTTDCASCHTAGYVGTPSDCYACHQTDYEGADPDHGAAGFPVDCVACHGTTAWEPADWDHDTLFPIYSGRHRNEWDACVDCHVTPTDYQIFECIFCHEHSRSETDSHHPLDEVPDYQYLSTACFECHPRGEED